MTGYDLIPIIADSTHDQRRHYPMRFNALNKSVHLFIVNNLVRVSLKGLQFTYLDIFQCFSFLSPMLQRQRYTGLKNSFSSINLIKIFFGACNSYSNIEITPLGLLGGRLIIE